MSKNDDLKCTDECVARRPLGGDHLSSCPLWEFQDGPGETKKVVSIYRNEETGRPIAVPAEIVTEAEREYRAYQLHIGGMDWNEVALAEGYPSASAAAASVKRYLDEGRAVVQDFTRKEVIAAHVGRLMALRAAFWEEAITHKKVSAGMFLLNIEDRWTKAFGLDVPDSEDTTVQTVVVPSEDYVEQLRLAVAEAEDAGEADAG